MSCREHLKSCCLLSSNLRVKKERETERVREMRPDMHIQTPTANINLNSDTKSRNLLSERTQCVGKSREKSGAHVGRKNPAASFPTVQLMKYQVTWSNTFTQNTHTHTIFQQDMYKTPTNANNSSRCYSYLIHIMILSHLSVT